MDPTLALVTLAGAACGFVAGALPGFHVNALALATLAVAPGAGAPGAGFLVAAFAASPFGAHFAGTFLGGHDDATALSGLPAHALAREGRGVEAVALQAWGALLGILLALPLAWATRPLWTALVPRLPALLPALLTVVLALLVLAEPRRLPVHRRLVVTARGAGSSVLRGRLRRRGGTLRVGGRSVRDPHGLLDAMRDGEPVEAHVEPRWEPGAASRWAGRAAALLVVGASGALGLLALPLGARSPLGLPATPLLPLLAGLFAGPALLAGLRAHPSTLRARLRAPIPPRGLLVRAALPGAAASSLLGILPGVSPAHAALLVPKADDPEHALVGLAAVNGGAVVFTLLAWHTLGKARSGVLVAAQALVPPVPWRQPLPPPDVLTEAAVVVAAAGLALGLARALAPAAARAARHPRRLARGGLVLLVAAVGASGGGLGLLMLAVATLVGFLPLRLGVRRSHAMGVLLVPSLLRALQA